MKSAHKVLGASGNVTQEQTAYLSLHQPWIDGTMNAP